ncbi:MAG: 8-amino-7-oxononanoate synthase [Leptospiraceae bacterium]|nr:8-amino-7-oxononanoate synthase [Leptospiraceae bacterium]
MQLARSAGRMDLILNQSDYNPQWHAWQNSLTEHLHFLAEQDRLRTLADSDLISFAANDYLGLNHDGLLARLLTNLAADTQQIGSTGSRLLSGHHTAYEKAETWFAAFTGSESSLFFSTGYAANVGTLQSILTSRDTVYADRACHASMLDGVRLSGARRVYFRHNDLNHLGGLLARHDGRGQAWILVESVYSMDGDRADLSGIADLARRYGALVYVDEAHAIGVWGQAGQGLSYELPNRNEIAVRVFPCGKAPGLMGAFVCGSTALTQTLINKARSFIFSTAQPPILAHLLHQALEWIASPMADPARQRLHQLAATTRSRIQAAGLSTLASDSQIVPVLCGSEARAMALSGLGALHGLDLRAIRPPTVERDTCRVRLCLNSWHTDEHLAVLFQVLEEYARQDAL